MNNFQFANPTKIIFGKDVIENLPKQLAAHQKILFHYGKNSIKRSGLYDKIIDLLKDKKIDVIELSGVEANPKLALVKEGIELCQKEKISFILAVGGGSVIDSAKAIAAGALYDGDIWDCFCGKGSIKAALPLGVVLTIPASGSENSPSAIITNEDGLYKRGIEADCLVPKFAIMDPSYTLTLSAEQTFAGVIDMYSHIHERYFTKTKNTALTDKLCEASFRTIIETAYKLKENLDDYQARAEIMLCGTIAHGGFLGLGRQEDWGSHRIGHEITALYGVTHGKTLAMIMPAWMKYVYKERADIFERFAIKVFDVNPHAKDQEEIILEGIKSLEKFIRDLDMPASLSEANIGSEDFEIIAEKCTELGPVGNFKKLYKEDVLNILELAK